MKYFIIAGEASGDLHASNLMSELKKEDAHADFCFLGGDLMQAQGGRMIRHYKDMAFMGVIPVIMNCRKILRNMKDCKSAIMEYHPDALILVDYPSFNLKIAKYVKETLPHVKIYYYIAPKLWAWKEYRLKAMKKYIDRVYSILPFEIEWFGKRGLEVEYVGNPCVDAVSNYNPQYNDRKSFLSSLQLTDKPVIALLAGSRMQEIKKCLPIMLQATSVYPDYQKIIAGAPSIESSVYEKFLVENNAQDVRVVYGETYELLKHSDYSVVTSGTATLETALMRVPQVVIYKMSGGKVLHKIKNLIIHVKYISLVNLIVNRKLVEELIIEEVTVERVRKEVDLLMKEDNRKKVLEGYDELISILGNEPVSRKAAHSIVTRLN